MGERDDFKRIGSDRIKSEMAKVCNYGVLLSSRLPIISAAGGTSLNLIPPFLYLFRQMHREGVKPTIVTYNTILQGLFKNQYIDEALSLFHEMECTGLIPDICIYNSLIDGLCKDGKLDMARNLFHSLPSKGLQLDVKTYTIMIQALCQEGLLEKANELLVEMEGSDCFPNDVTYNTIIRGCFQKGASRQITLLAMCEKFLRRTKDRKRKVIE